MSRLYAALLAHHAANVNRANPWPTGAGAVTTRTKGATMAQDEREGVTSDTEAVTHPIPPDGVNEAAVSRVQLAFALETIVWLKHDLAEARATIARMRTGRP